ncbi:GGDEF domain-containing protein [Propionispora vibrioides]|uniref:Diguanylate cyclase (GGDEF) domain-containing protein n=1 Tax=Propionispora vibrioides TaxID=112903 RepID=A0A1H8W674_9FIRM|nr:GGDEF domain-containing protein [Propionispora vibrioides]SEP23154.1 diguanylate cyclase (GGDEF) domain-containing protein [Propionispora vibrioides]
MTKIMSIATTIPFALLIVASIIYLCVPIEQPLLSITYYSSYAIYCVGLMLSWWFNRSRFFFTITVIALVQVALSDWAAATIGITAYRIVIYPIVCVLLPINIFVFSLLKERGIFNGWGLQRFGIIFFQIFYIAVAVVSNDNALVSFFYKKLLTEPLPLVTAIPQPAILIYGIVFLLFLLKLGKNKSHLDSTSTAVLAATMIGLHLKAEPLAMPAFFSLAGIIFIITVIQASYSMAYLDELTGLPARRALRENMMKLSGEYTIAMLDIDFFKKFNDTYGHDTGDDVLRLVASLLQNITGGGKAFRYGGEEFTIIFPNTKIEEAMPHLEKLRMAVEKCPHVYEGKTERTRKKKISSKQLFVTISIGVAERNKKYRHVDEVIKAADTALYRAKKKGRNCVSK